MDLGRPVSKHINPAQLHKDSPLSPQPSSSVPVRYQREAEHLHPPFRPDPVTAYSGLQDDHHLFSSIPTKDRKQRRSAKEWSAVGRLLCEENIPVQLLASNSMSSENPVDFSCLEGSPFVYRGKDRRRVGESRESHRSPMVRRSLEQVSSSASRYIPCRIGGLGSGHIGSSEWTRAISQEQRRKEYGSLLRVGWQLKAQRHSGNIFQVPRGHPRSYSDDFDK